MYRESRQPVFKDVTPEECEYFLAINNFPGQKKYNPVTGRFYADLMEQKSFRRGDIAVAKVKEKNQDYTVNGQHFSNGVILYGKPYPACISYYICDTIEDAWRLFSTFDIHKTRSEQQIMKGRRGIFDDQRLQEVPLRVLQACGTALLYLGKGTEPRIYNIKNVVKTTKADYVDRYPEEVLFVDRYSEYDHMINIGCITCMISTYRKDEEAATIFWDSVGDGVKLEKRDPRKMLRETLLKNDYFKGAGGAGRQKITYQLCGAWWNSWRTGKNRTTVKLASMNGITKIV